MRRSDGMLCCALGLLASQANACTGRVSDSAQEAGAAAGAAGPTIWGNEMGHELGMPPVQARDPEAFFPGNTSVPTEVRLWRLSWEQYDGALSDLLGRDVRPSVELDFPLQPVSAAGWLNEARFLEIDAQVASVLAAAAERYAPEIARTLPACAAGDEGCLRGGLRALGRKLFRRPLTDAEIERYLGVQLAAARELGAPAAAEVVVQGMLRSPYFLHRTEVGDGGGGTGGRVTLTGHEVSASLAFALWNRPPDAALAADADAGVLLDRQARADAARRMLDDPRAASALWSFTSQWLGFHGIERVRKDTAHFPEFQPQVTGAAMAEDVRRRLRALLESGADFTTLMTSPRVFAPAALDWIYGPGTSSGDERADRFGILTSPAFLAAHASEVEWSPTNRGVFVVKKLLCFEPPPPPDEALGSLPDPGPGLSTRERFLAHQANPSCRACHGFFDPIGLAFGNYDAVGRYQTHEAGRPIDVSATLAAGVMGDEPVAFTGPRDVAEQLARSAVAHHCVVRNLFEYVYGRVATTTDAPVLRSAMRAFVDSQLDLRALVVALVSADEYVTRRVAAP